MKVARAGAANPDQAAQFQAWLTLVDQKYGEKYDRLEQLLAKKTQSILSILDFLPQFWHFGPFWCLPF